MQLDHRAWGCLALQLASCFLLQFASADEPSQPPEAGASGIEFEVLDSQGNPAVGAVLARFAAWSDDAEPEFFGTAGKADRHTDSSGVVSLPADEVRRQLNELDIKHVLIYARDATEGALVPLDVEDIGSAKQVELKPLCAVIGKIKSNELRELNQELTWSACYAYYEDDRPFLSTSKAGELRMMLPPGEYTFGAYGSDLVMSQKLSVEIPAGALKKEVEIDLAASNLARIIGKPAPSLEHVKAWSGEPLSLKELRGKVVLLDFWGYWCGPCVQTMPEVFKLHDELAESGLVVIALHDDRVDSMADLEEKIAPYVEELWDGRKIPFPIAIDGGGATPVPGTDKSVKGKTVAAYGISSWPSVIAIDRKGNVIGEVNYHTEEGRKAIRALLEEPPAP